MIGFAAGFFILFEGRDFEGEIGHRSLGMSILYSYSIMLSGFALSDIEGSSNAVITAVLFVIFTYFINIVMLNLLIALMGDIFDKIQENAGAEFMFARAQIILTYEMVYSDLLGKEKENFPKWLQVLVPVLKESEDLDYHEWDGRMRALRRAIKDVKTELSEKIDATLLEVQVLRNENAKMQEKKYVDSLALEEIKKMLKMLIPKVEGRGGIGSV